jgi:hypothetical protein
LLNTNSGIFFEFIPVENAFDEVPKRLNLEQVELGKDYVIIISTDNNGFDCVWKINRNNYDTTLIYLRNLE